MTIHIYRHSWGFDTASDRRIFASSRSPGYAAALHRPAFTLPEVMISVVMTIVIAMGSLSYQYFGAKHSRAAQAQDMATRVAQLVLEDWKSTGGDADYDPLTLDMGFAAAEPEESADYVITLDRQTFFVQLVRNDVDQDDVAGITLREIRVMVKWRKDYSRGAVVSSDPSLALTTYVRRDTD